MPQDKAGLCTMHVHILGISIPLFHYFIIPLFAVPQLGMGMLIRAFMACIVVTSTDGLISEIDVDWVKMLMNTHIY